VVDFDAWPPHSTSILSDLCFLAADVEKPVISLELLRLLNIYVLWFHKFHCLIASYYFLFITRVVIADVSWLRGPTQTSDVLKKMLEDTAMVDI